eukprot:jgi/Chlat1/2817/Chrsp187S02923
MQAAAAAAVKVLLLSCLLLLGGVRAVVIVEVPNVAAKGGGAVVWAPKDGSLPEEWSDALCGSWLASYHHALHSSSSPTRPTKTVTYLGPPHRGLGDVFAGVNTAFLIAVLARRRFEIYWPDHEPAFSSPYLDTRFTPSLHRHNATLPQLLYSRLHHDGKVRRLEEGDQHYGVTDWTNGVEWFVGKLKESGTDGALPHDREFIRSNRGLDWALFGLFPQRVKELGWVRETAFSCGLNFVFAPGAAVRSRVDRYTNILTDPNVLSIGIHVRTIEYAHVGDDVFEGDPSAVPRYNLTADLFHAFFSCAEDVERDRNEDGEAKVVWFFASDSNALREDVRRVYGDKVLLFDSPPSHISHSHFSSSSRSPASSLRDTFAEWHALGACDYYVVSPSEFSTLAVGRSFKRESTFIIPKTRPKGPPEVASCRVKDRPFDAQFHRWN